MVELVVSPSGVIKNAFLVFLIGVGIGYWLHSRVSHTPLFPSSSSITPTPAPERPPYYYYDYE